MSKKLTVNGKHTFVPSSKDSNGSKMEIPCGQCIGCRLDRSREWAARISAEASLYDQNCFITLTYAPENLPENGSLVLEHFQLFMKRLRKNMAQTSGSSIVANMGSSSVDHIIMHVFSILTFLISSICLLLLVAIKFTPLPPLQNCGHTDTIKSGPFF